MAGDDKTEAATPKKRSEARTRGQVAKSMEISSMTVLLGVLLSLHSGVGRAGGLMRTYLEATFTHLDDPRLSIQIVVQLAGHLALVLAQCLTPMLLTAMLLGIVVNIAQTGPLWSPQALKPNFNKLNPLNGVKRLVSPRSLVELVKSSYKIGLVMWIAWTDDTRQLPAADAQFANGLNAGHGHGVRDGVPVGPAHRDDHARPGRAGLRVSAVVARKVAEDDQRGGAAGNTRGRT